MIFSGQLESLKILVWDFYVFHIVLKSLSTSWKMLSLNTNLFPNSQLPSSSLFSATSTEDFKREKAVKGLAALHFLFLWVFDITVTPNHYFLLKNQPSNNNVCSRPASLLKGRNVALKLLFGSLLFCSFLVSVSPF